MLFDFPFLTVEEFHSACQDLASRLRACGSLKDSSWSAVRLIDQTNGLIFRITKSIGNVDASKDETAPEEDSGFLETEQNQAEEDPEALIRSEQRSTDWQVEYEIVYSPTFQVPVLYFALKAGAFHHKPVDIEMVYQHLVPQQYHQELKNVGVMGGISFNVGCMFFENTELDVRSLFQYNPVSGSPMFFVHPCNTADAMRHVIVSKDISPETYLLIWLSVIGNFIKLHLPHELFVDDTPVSLKFQGPSLGDAS
ncbi:hypothetical protein ASPZODRAFT_1674623 [Penicilliopsis zonata CBS 506.65]|uniref:Ubiquitin-like-conjugating enzyme ATG10 n=1 Tax=Penicilliopsis zonata CBS 506.65 TaxID=1073090 RepID=A0A1L9SJR8_9EURO|nr:hypothetical protein ASPZODRAFT_1674623 [Penicilliopsis zonata CBS 506.65]OJJ47438.1 hypothetical protein ASPZODRAFT_1674623 [Penicilliopsis zonata CBS 506.65]